MFPSRVGAMPINFPMALPEGVDFAKGENTIEFDGNVGLGPILSVSTGGEGGDAILVDEPRVKKASAQVDEGIRMVEDVRSFGVYETAGREDRGVEGIGVVGAVDYGAAFSVVLRWLRPVSWGFGVFREWERGERG